jgi:type I restriction enzyme, S subunit
MTYPAKKLGEVCELQNGFAFKSNEYVSSGYFVTRIANVQDGYISQDDPKYINASRENEFKKFILSEDDILISLTGNVGRVGIIKKSHLPAVLNQRVARIKPSDRIDKKYLFFLIRSPQFYKKIIAKGHGMAQMNVSTRDIENFEIPLPSLEIQKKIAAKLEELLGKISEAEKLREEAITATNSLFASELHKIFEDGKKKGWEEQELGQVCTLYQGLAINVKTKHLLVKKSKLPLLRIKDLRDNTEEQYVSEKGYPSGALVNENDILYTRTGQVGLVFKGRKGVLHNNCFKVIPHGNLSNDFLFWFLHEPSFSSTIINLSSRTAQPDITHKNFKAQKIPIPPLSEQKKIVARLDALAEKVRELQKLQSETAEDLKKLKQSILQKAFQGELVS